MTAIDLSALEADLAALSDAGRGGSTCRIQEVAKENPDAIPLIKAAIASHASADAVSRVLRKNGVDIGKSSILRHRNGDCSYCREAQS